MAFRVLDSSAFYAGIPFGSNQPSYTTSLVYDEIKHIKKNHDAIDILIEIGWIKPSGRKNIPGKPVLWITTDQFIEHFGIKDISNLPNKDELKSSGFLEKRSAIATITDLASKENELDQENLTEENKQKNSFTLFSNELSDLVA